MAKGKDQSLHDEILEDVTRMIAREDDGIRADGIDGYERPPVIRWKGHKEGMIPDVLSNKYIVEVETDDTISSEHTTEQWRLFSAYARKNMLSFLIVVPEGSGEVAEQCLRELGIDARVEES